MQANFETERFASVQVCMYVCMCPLAGSLYGNAVEKTYFLNMLRSLKIKLKYFFVKDEKLKYRAVSLRSQL